MRLLKPGIRNTISAMLGFEARKNSPEALEPIRRAMLAALGEEGALINPHLTRRLNYLADAHALWYARSEMMSVLSQLHGEAEAAETVQKLSPIFRGLIPNSLIDSCRLRR